MPGYMQTVYRRRYIGQYNYVVSLLALDPKSLISDTFKKEWAIINTRPPTRFRKVSGRLINNFGLNSVSCKIAAGCGLTQIQPAEGLISAKVGRPISKSILMKPRIFRIFKILKT